MAPIVEFEDKTVEGAVTEASEKLNIPAHKLKYDVISYGSTGIFSLVGVKRAKIRVSIPDDTSPKATKKAAEKKPAPENKPSGEIKPLDEKKPFESEKDPTAVEDAPDVLPEDEDPAAVEKLGREALQMLVDHVTSDAFIQAGWQGGKIVYNITGGHTAVLIGKRGQTLEALQYLVEKIINKQSSKRIRVEIDVEGYLEKKRDKLISQAVKLGEKVKQTKKPATVGQLNAYDRRIVHLALKADSELRTHSIGDGYYRKLKIFPKQRKRRGKSHKAESR